jgi:hypothetical protein
LTERITVTEYRRLQGLSEPDAAPVPGKRSKFNNVRSQGADSRLEARRLVAAEARAASGEIIGTCPQPSLVYGVDENGKYRRTRPDRMDVLEHYDDGSMRVRFVDVKGRRGKRKHGRHGTDTELSQAKRAALRLGNILVCVEE